MDEQAQRTAYEQSANTAEQSKRCLLAALARFGVPARMLDIGCGPGHLVRTAAALGAYAMGLDINVVQEDTCPHGDGTYDLFEFDLTMVKSFLEPFDLVLCLEVAEHLPESAADNLCEAVASAVAPGGVLLFSAATPGQGGAGHVNEQEAEYWIDKLAAHGVWWDSTGSIALRGVWATVAPDAWWYGKNLLMFRRQEAGND